MPGGEEKRAPARGEETRREALLSRALDREAALALEALMSDLSEELFFARWETGIEDDLWRMVEADDGGPYGMGYVTCIDLGRLRDLSEKAGGWWRLDEFVPIAEWINRKR